MERRLPHIRQQELAERFQLQWYRASWVSLGGQVGEVVRGIRVSDCNRTAVEQNNQTKDLPRGGNLADGNYFGHILAKYYEKTRWLFVSGSGRFVEKEGTLSSPNHMLTSLPHIGQITEVTKNLRTSFQRI